MGRFQPIPFQTFLGKNESSSPQEMNRLELVRATNVYRRGNAFGTRPGFQFETTGFNAAIAGAPAIQGIHEYRNRASGGSLIVIANGNVYNNDEATALGEGAGAIITAGLDNVWTFAEHNNRLYMAGGADGDTPLMWDGGATVVEVVFQNSAAADIDAKYVFEKWNYGFLAGMDGTAPEDNPMVVRYSVLADMTLWPVANTIGGTSAIGGLSSYGDEFVTGLADFTDNQGDWVLILSNKRLYSVAQTPDALTPFYIDSEIQNGCVHQRAFVSLGLDSGEAIYLSENGIHSLRQSQQHGNASDKFLSWKIRETFSTINRSKIDKACGAYDPATGLVLFAVPTGSSTVNDTVLVLDLRGVAEINADTARWYVWFPQSSLNGNCLTTARDSSTAERFVYMGDTSGRVVRAQDTIWGDMSAPYSVSWQTKHDDHGDSTIDKGIGDLFVSLITATTAYTPTVQPIFNYGVREGVSLPIDSEASSGAEWDVAVWNVDSWSSSDLISVDRLYGRGSGITVGWRFSHSAYNQPFWVTQFTPQVRLLGETSAEGT